jgi:ABC-type multidrug transport system permease subunit
MTPFNFLRKKITPGLSLESVEFLTYLLTYVSNLFRILVSSSSSKLRKASLVVVVVVVGRWFL